MTDTKHPSVRSVKKKSFVAFLIIFSSAIVAPALASFFPSYGKEVASLYFVIAVCGGFSYAVCIRCPHCQRRFSENFSFARAVILLWAAKDKCPFCGGQV